MICTATLQTLCGGRPATGRAWGARGARGASLFPPPPPLHSLPSLPTHTAQNATLLKWATGWAESWGYACKGSSNANDQVCGGAYSALYKLAPSPEKLALDVTMGEMVANASSPTVTQPW